MLYTAKLWRQADQYQKLGGHSISVACKIQKNKIKKKNDITFAAHRHNVNVLLCSLSYFSF